MKTLEQYLTAAAAVGIIDFALRATVLDGRPVTVCIHPLGRDGETADFLVDGDRVVDARLGALVGPKPDASVTLERRGDQVSGFSPVGIANGISMAIGYAPDPGATFAQSLDTAVAFVRERLDHQPIGDLPPGDVIMISGTVEVADEAQTDILPADPAV